MIIWPSRSRLTVPSASMTSAACHAPSWRFTPKEASGNVWMDICSPWPHTLPRTSTPAWSSPGSPQSELSYVSSSMAYPSSPAIASPPPASPTAFGPVVSSMNDPPSPSPSWISKESVNESVRTAFSYTMVPASPVELVESTPASVPGVALPLNFQLGGATPLNDVAQVVPGAQLTGLPVHVWSMPSQVGGCGRTSPSQGPQPVP